MSPTSTSGSGARRRREPLRTPAGPGCCNRLRGGPHGPWPPPPRLAAAGRGAGGGRGEGRGGGVGGAGGRGGGRAVGRPAFRCAPLGVRLVVRPPPRGRGGRDRPRPPSRGTGGDLRVDA